MNTFVVVLAIASVLIALWLTFVSPRIRGTPWPNWLAWFEPIAIVGWRKSETIFKARAKMLLGLILTALTQIGAVDITPLMPLVPDAWEPTVKAAFNLIPLILTVGGWIDEQLRKDTTKPIEVVALPTIKPPEVAAAVAKAEVAVQQAVAVVKAEEVKVAVETATTPKGSA